MTTNTLKKHLAIAYKSPTSQRREPLYTVSLLFDVTVIIAGIVSAVGYFLS